MTGQQAQSSAGIQRQSIRFPIQGIIEDNGATGVDDFGTNDAVVGNLPGLGPLGHDPSGVPAGAASATPSNILDSVTNGPHDGEVGGAGQQGNKKQPRKKNDNRPKTNPAEQSTGIDINKPRHPPTGAAGTPTKQSRSFALPPQFQEANGALASNKKSSPSPGLFNKSTTPMKLYAGPTFHASPAPSSLPIPKFFSKSVPPADKPLAPVAKTPEDRSDEGSSSALEDSPTMKNSLRAEHIQPRGPSPLDMFFHADRQEKANRSFPSPGMRPSGSRAHSSSPSLQAPRAHSRHLTGGSIFPMEMESGGPPKTPNERRAELSPTTINQEQTVEEKARAKTEALKQLLSFPSKQTTSSPLSHATSPPASTQLSTDESLLQHLRDTVLGGETSDHHASMPKSYERRQGPFAPPPATYHPPEAVRATPAHPMMSSQLRNEVTTHNDSTNVSYHPPPRVPALVTPATHMPQQPYSYGPAHQAHHVHTASNSHGWPGHHPVAPPAPARDIAAEDAMVLANLQQHLGPFADGAEDELRKILKIDRPSAGAPSS